MENFTTIQEYDSWANYFTPKQLLYNRQDEVNLFVVSPLETARDQWGLTKPYYTLKRSYGDKQLSNKCLADCLNRKRDLLLKLSLLLGANSGLPIPGSPLSTEYSGINGQGSILLMDYMHHKLQPREVQTNANLTGLSVEDLHGKTLDNNFLKQLPEIDITSNKEFKSNVSDWDKFFKNIETPDPRLVITLLKDVMDKINICEKEGLLNTDIKPANLVVFIDDNNYKANVIDLQSLRELKKGENSLDDSIDRTVNFEPIHNKKRFKDFFYSLGLSIMSLYGIKRPGNYPYESVHEKLEIEKHLIQKFNSAMDLLETKSIESPGVFQDFKNLVNQFLTIDADNRLESKELRSHVDQFMTKHGSYKADGSIEEYKPKKKSYKIDINNEQAKLLLYNFTEPQYASIANLEEYLEVLDYTLDRDISFYSYKLEKQLSSKFNDLKEKLEIKFPYKCRNATLSNKYKYAYALKLVYEEDLGMPDLVKKLDKPIQEFTTDPTELLNAYLANNGSYSIKTIEELIEQGANIIDPKQGCILLANLLSDPDLDFSNRNTQPQDFILLLYGQILAKINPDILNHTSNSQGESLSEILIKKQVNFQLIKLLIQKGLKIKNQSQSGENLISKVIIDSSSNSRQDLERLAIHMLENSSQVERQDTIYQLITSQQTLDPEIAEELFSKTDSLNQEIKTFEGIKFNALEYALEQNNIPCILALINKSGINIYQESSNGKIFKDLIKEKIGLQDMGHLYKIILGYIARRSKGKLNLEQRTNYLKQVLNDPDLYQALNKETLTQEMKLFQGTEFEELFEIKLEGTPFTLCIKGQVLKK